MNRPLKHSIFLTLIIFIIIIHVDNMLDFNSNHINILEILIEQLLDFLEFLTNIINEFVYVKQKSITKK